jgi:hypothetical protein
MKKRRVDLSSLFTAGFFILIFLTLCFSIGSCAGEPLFKSLQGKEWKLVELRIEPVNPGDPLPDNINFDRLKLKAEGMDDIFVLTFDTAAVSGKAAPETYTASYEVGKDQALSLRQVNVIPSDKVVSPERLRETDYFVFLKKIKRWAYDQGTLELYTETSDGAQAILRFSTE